MMPQVDRKALEFVLKASGGVNLRPAELDIIVMEYEPLGQNGTAKIDFEAFDKDFKMFLQGKHFLNNFQTG